MWYALVHEERLGPMGQDEILNLYLQGIIGENTAVWKEGMTSWQPLGQISELTTLLSRAFQNNALDHALDEDEDGEGETLVIDPGLTGLDETLPPDDSDPMPFQENPPATIAPPQTSRPNPPATIAPPQTSRPNPPATIAPPQTSRPNPPATIAPPQTSRPNPLQSIPELKRPQEFLNSIPETQMSQSHLSAIPELQGPANVHFQDPAPVFESSSSQPVFVNQTQTGKKSFSLWIAIAGMAVALGLLAWVLLRRPTPVAPPAPKVFSVSQLSQADLPPNQTNHGRNVNQTVEIGQNTDVLGTNQGGFDQKTDVREANLVGGDQKTDVGSSNGANLDGNGGEDSPEDGIPQEMVGEEWNFDPIVVPKEVSRPVRQKDPAKTSPQKPATLPISLSRQQIESVVKARARNLQTCIDQLPQMKGSTINVQVVIKRDGSVSSAQVTTSRVRNSDFAHCVEKQVKSYRFDAFSGDPMRIQLPFLL